MDKKIKLEHNQSFEPRSVYLSFFIYKIKYSYQRAAFQESRPIMSKNNPRKLSQNNSWSFPEASLHNLTEKTEQFVTKINYIKVKKN